MSAPQPGWCHACQHTVNLVSSPSGPSCPSCGSDFVELVSPAYAPAPPLVHARPPPPDAPDADDDGEPDSLFHAVLRNLANPDPPTLGRGPMASDPTPPRSGTFQLGPFSLGWQTMPFRDAHDTRSPNTTVPNPFRPPGSPPSPPPPPAPARGERDDQPESQPHDQPRPRAEGLPRSFSDFMDDLGRRAGAAGGAGTFGPYTFTAPGGRTGGTGDTPPPPRDDPISRLLGFIAPFTFGDLSALQESWEDVIRAQTGGGGEPPASEETIAQLPRFGLDDARRHDEGKVKNPNECPICTDEFSPAPPAASADSSSSPHAPEEAEQHEGFDPDIPTDQLMLMPCGHLFHAACLVPWLKMHNTCPVCRAHLQDPERGFRSARSTTSADRRDGFPPLPFNFLGTLLERASSPPPRTHPPFDPARPRSPPRQPFNLFPWRGPPTTESAQQGAPRGSADRTAEAAGPLGVSELFFGSDPSGFGPLGRATDGDGADGQPSGPAGSAGSAGRPGEQQVPGTLGGDVHVPGAWDDGSSMDYHEEDGGHGAVGMAEAGLDHSGSGRDQQGHGPGAALIRDQLRRAAERRAAENGEAHRAWHEDGQDDLD